MTEYTANTVQAIKAAMAAKTQGDEIAYREALDNLLLFATADNWQELNPEPSAKLTAEQLAERNRRIKGAKW